jgi:hypothetical protein
MLATTIHKSNTTPHHQSRATTKPPSPQGEPPHTRGVINLRFPIKQGKEVTGLLSQSPIVCLAIPSPAFDHSKPVPAQRLLCTRP